MTNLAIVNDWIKSINLPADDSMPAWLRAKREKHMQVLQQHGFPNRRNERWKYSDISMITSKQYTISCDQHNVKLAAAVNRHRLKNADAIFIVFIDGVFAPQYSDLNRLPQQVIVSSLRQAFDKHEKLISTYFNKDINHQDYPFAALNAALFVDGLFLHVPKDTKIESPLHLLYLSSDKDANLINPNNLLMFGENSQSSIVSEYAAIAESYYFTNTVTTIVMEGNAQADIVKLQHESQNAIHMENFFVSQKEYSKLMLTNIATGGSFVRDDVIVMLDEQGAECRTGGFYHARHDGHYVDNHIEVNHLAPNTQSEMLYKGIGDHQSTMVFNGRLFVEKHAQKINAFQANHNLLLSSRAEVYSKPELEIYADDVKCKHGATTGQIDQDALFYMRSRGISQQAATRILLKGFADEVMERIAHPAIREQARQQVDFL